jgi:hypothetical protein
MADDLYTIILLISVLLGQILTYMLNSRCTKIESCCFKVERDVLPPDHLVEMKK